MSQQWQNEEHQQQFLDTDFKQQIQVPRHQTNPATPSNNLWLNQYDGIPPVPQALPSQLFGPTLLSSTGSPPAPNTVSPPRHASLPHRMLHSVPFLKPACDEACWRCRNSHTKCEPRFQTPCRRCAANKGNVKIRCVRGDVCTLVDEVPFLCHLPAAADRLSHLSHLPRDLQQGAILLGLTKQRRHVDRSKYKGGGMPDPNRRLFWSVVNTNVPNINSFNPFQDLGVSFVKVPYDDLIINIVWEVEDYPTAAERVGIGSITHLVALLEAASLCESRYGHHEPSKRLIFSAMKLLLYCLEGLRLLDHGLLAANNHAYCTEATGCICPIFQGLTKYGERYTEALTKALFSKKRDSDERKIWPMVFYSLCLQAHVRRALMVIEARLHGLRLTCINPSAGGLVDLGCKTPSYLVAAITLFEQISLQKDGKLALKVSNVLAQVQPSIYLKEASINAGNINWGNWHNEQENIPRYLRSIFAVPNHPLQRIHPLASGPPMDLDYNLEVPVAPPPPTPNMETAANVVATVHDWDVNMTPYEAPVTVSTGLTPTAGSQFHGVRGIPDPDPHRDDEIASYFTRTSHAASSDTWTLDTMSVAESVASTVTVTYNQPASMGSSTLHVPMGANSAHGYGTFNQEALARSWEQSYQEQNRGHFPSS